MSPLDLNQETNRKLERGSMTLVMNMMKRHFSKLTQHDNDAKLTDTTQFVQI